ncbi:hypothetical protein B0H10DRAFT_1962611 [Mycena sp. CBHHK59/15]|nr:hypothetical protein B0H10DRAFT_1962611 [Mycena sp. CBHHK59/15]
MGPASSAVAQADEEHKVPHRARCVPRKRAFTQAILSDDEKDCDEPGCEEFGELGIIQCDGPACDAKFHLCCRGLSKQPATSWYCDDYCRENAGARRRANGGERSEIDGNHGSDAIKKAVPDTGFFCGYPLSTTQKGRKSGWGWDDVGHFIVVDDDVWKEYIKTCPDAKKWCTTPYPLYDDMADLVDGGVATGTNLFVPGQQAPAVPELTHYSARHRITVPDLAVIDPKYRSCNYILPE